MSRITVLVADDHPIYRKGLARVFGRDPTLDLVAVASDGEEALNGLRRLTPQVAVLDLVMPKKSGLEIIETLKSEKLSTKLILLTGSAEQDVIYQAVAAGAQGYLLKTADWDDLILATKKVAQGETIIAPEVVSILATQIRQHSDRDMRIAFTKRELAVLQLATSSVAEIALKLGIRESTVKSHLQSIYRKLNVSSRAAAIAKAMEWGVMPHE